MADDKLKAGPAPGRLCWGCSTRRKAPVPETVEEPAAGPACQPEQSVTLEWAGMFSPACAAG